MSITTRQDFIEGDYLKILTCATANKILGHEHEYSTTAESQDLIQSVDARIKDLLDGLCDDNLREEIIRVGCAALHAFLQSNVTGPPLAWDPFTTVISQRVRDSLSRSELHAQLTAALTVDGEAVYTLIPNIELFCLARSILDCSELDVDATAEGLRFRMRLNFWHQRMLSDIAPALQDLIYRDLGILEKNLPLSDPLSRAGFLVERATIDTYYGFDIKARDDIFQAARLRKFEYALTGRLGKRTKFQEKELSQLVVLAKSANDHNLHESADSEGIWSSSGESNGNKPDDRSKPVQLQLNDETLLESISFSKDESTPTTGEEENLSSSLQDLDPANQPMLDPIDSIILLATASSITNTSPQDGLTREETLPYATRVLTGGSNNWQIYTQALIVRSRIEGYRSRTAERGLLQLQAVVDQVIIDTTSNTLEHGERDKESFKAPTTTFLPQLKPSESAPVSERLQYIHHLASPTRWKLESELANRWVSLGGLRSALEIYERLQMWAEVALCWAAQDREDKARSIIRYQLFVPPEDSAGLTPGNTEDKSTGVNESTKERDPLPNDAPRLFCILGDIEKSPSAYQRAWEVSKNRYARAQRSLGKHYFAMKDLKRSDEAYAKSLKINPQNHSIRFALGCVRLQMEDWPGAVDCFSRAVQIEEKDAESWSNLAAALLRLTPELTRENPTDRGNDDPAGNGEDLNEDIKEVDPQKHVREAYAALKRAASLKRDSYRIWQNLLHVSTQLSPPPYTDIIIAQTRLIELRSKVDGEKCIDIAVVEGLVSHLITTSTPQTNQDTHVNSDTESEPRTKRLGFERMVVDLVQKKITPLITSSRRLWLLTAKLSLYLRRPSAALAAYEKAWRVTTNQPGWDSGTKESELLWKEVAEATSDLADGYESLGERPRETGLGEGELVAKDWRFKARSAVRGIIGRAKDVWEGSEELEMLKGKMEELKSV